MVQYEEMSLFYDQLTLDQPYDAWLDIVQTHAKDNASILDIGCGTGSFTSLLSTYNDVTGMDLSVDMLAMASQKSTHVNWLEGDMTDFDFNRQFDVITIFCDSLNYLQDQDDVIATFQHVNKHLMADGVLMFDVHTTHKMDTLFNNQSYIDESEDIYLGWEAVQGEEKHSVWHDMSFFIKKENGQYERFNESHYQRTYSKNEYIDMLKQTGFTKIKTFVDFDINNKDDENGHRLFFIVKK
ncbi:class I SAM-dependent DNA methyltransferase [Staphylococcus gallinarum]|uniref:class I SAM-dependent DNA methyltransferase n=1 Tax=Staphylococcus gallinarum TaxID=1293 RepID=UPI001E4C7927|nr:class I SAM-dependent methyltransferase [Staphylococcus gallinarum]MCD8919327.1 class I SAM-dependent methyltransferase [Staphylococcus gallinarum]MEB6276802.1 class I SAM-dependent methyltransferase [Staphylococcus gallinarum]UEH01785.1 class I SAM-dependent methyltransferase [Staphylococcus gallinarum]